METLLEKIKPKYIKKIKSSDYTYSASKILAKLESSTWYGELTISEVSEIYDICGIEKLRVSAWDIRFGDNLLIKEDE
jgi:hypothetical protein